MAMGMARHMLVAVRACAEIGAGGGGGMALETMVQVCLTHGRLVTCIKLGHPILCRRWDCAPPSSVQAVSMSPPLLRTALQRMLMRSGLCSTPVHDEHVDLSPPRLPTGLPARAEVR